MTSGTEKTPERPRRAGFGEDFRRFFLRGLAAVLPTLITLWLLVWAWNFLWEALGRHIIWGIRRGWAMLVSWGLVPFQPQVYRDWYWELYLQDWQVKLLGVGLAVLLVYIVGLLVGNLIGRTIWRLLEVAVMRVPLVRAIYPAVKQVTDFVLDERKQRLHYSRVVAVQPHEKGIWSIGLVTGPGLKPLSDAVNQEMLTVFVPSSPTSFSGYVLVVPRESVVELPMSVEEAMRLLVSGGVISPGEKKAIAGRSAETKPAVPEAPPLVKPGSVAPSPGSGAGEGSSQSESAGPVPGLSER